MAIRSQRLPRTLVHRLRHHSASVARRRAAGLGRRGRAGGVRANDDEAGGRLATELGYGLPAIGGRFTCTPHAGFALTDSAREHILGWRLGLVCSGSTTLDLGHEATRREPMNDDAPKHTVGLKLRASW